ncbi:MAG: hypothetical protein LAN64_15660 [Acidobacteriia bacterium]|nr:hypothetical protein [Terriglobia bacterium]
MKRAFPLVAIAAIAVGSWATYQALAPTPKPLSAFMPPDAILYLEAKSFSGLLAEWNASAQKASWVKSDNFAVFSRSRLFQRLERAQREFAAAAGLPPDMNFATAVAGEQSALAIYDIGNLEFVYVTRMKSAKSMQTAIWQLRSKFEPRSANGASFFVHADPQSKRVVGFGATDEYFVLGTREDLIAGAMALVVGQQGRNLAQDEWYRKAIAAALKQGGDLRMVLDLAEIAQTPQFRTYWAQQNITETRQYSAAVVDLYRSATEYREERVLLRAGDQESEGGEEPRQGLVTAEGMKAVADVVKFVPDGAGVYRAVANPTPREALRLMVVKVLAPHIGLAPVQHLAPKVALTSGEAGSESDLETRVDQQPASRYSSERVSDELEGQLAQARVQALLQVEGTQRAANGVFIGPRTVLVFVASSDWNGEAIRTALQRALQPGLTASHLGLEWTQTGASYRLNGLMPIAMALQGKYMFVSDDPARLDAMVARSGSASTIQPATYAAGFNHQGERENFLRLTGLVHRAAAPPERDVAAQGSDAAEERAPKTKSDAEAPEREPDFFSENIASLSATLKDVKAESIVVRQAASRVRQTVTYTWSK